MLLCISKDKVGRGGSRERLRDRQAATVQNGGTTLLLKQFLFDLPIFISIFCGREASIGSCSWTGSKQGGKGVSFSTSTPIEVASFLVSPEFMSLHLELTLILLTWRIG